METSEKSRLTVGIPSGSMETAVIDLLNKADFQIGPKSRKYEAVPKNNAKIQFLRRERKWRISKCLARGDVDLAIIGEDYAINSKCRERFEPIGESFVLSRATQQKTRIILQANQADADFKGEKLYGKIIATEMLNLTKSRFMVMYGLKDSDFVVIRMDNPEINSPEEEQYLIDEAVRQGKIVLLESDGSTEGTIIPNNQGETEADYCTEIVETGSSMKTNKLSEIATIFESGPCLFINEKEKTNEAILKAGLEIYLKIQRVLLPEIQGWQLRKMNVPKESLNSVMYLLKQEFPDKSPTLSQEFSEDWESLEIVLTDAEYAKISWKLLALGVDKIISEPVKKYDTQDILKTLNPNIFPDREFINKLLMEI